MDNCIPDWTTEFGAEFPLPVHKKPLGLENELMELLWENGDVVLHNQTNSTQSKQVHNHDQSNPNNPIQDYETISWIDGSFGKEFYADHHFSEIPPSNTVEPNKPFGKSENGKANKFSASEANHVSLPLPPPSSDQNTGSIVKNDTSFRLAVKEYGISHVEQGLITECSVKTVNPSRDETSSHKRKSRDVEESECRSDATELDSAGGSGNKSSQKSGTTRGSRLAEVHNLSERRRRDRINERMKALQELIPHSNKSDKASMLDEAIEYMKSLQWQLQLMWMGSGMAPMMLPGMQQYTYRPGTGPPMLPSVQNLVHLSRSPLVDQAMNIATCTSQEAVGHLSLVNYQNQMQLLGFPEQHANYMGFHTIPSTLQPTNMFDFGFHSAQQNRVLQPPDNGNGSVV